MKTELRPTTSRALEGVPQLFATLTPGPRFSEWAGELPQYIALDVDGTVTAENDVSPRVRAARNLLRPTGIRVGAATGRAAEFMESISAVLDYDAPAILQNGAEIWSGSSLLRRRGLGVHRTDTLRELADREQLFLELFDASGGWFVDRYDDFVAEFDQHLSAADGLMPQPTPAESFDAVKATIIVSAVSHADRLSRSIASIGLACESHAVPTEAGHVYLNITDPRSTKGEAVQFVADHLGVPLARTMVVGDGANDISMLKVAGTAVAMDQADDAIKAHAHLIAPSVFDDGVADVLELVAAKVGVPVLR
jgi:Cof subfamily protein (haloacid dehalogenase superfamily)